MHLSQKEFCLSVKNKFPDSFKNCNVLDIGSLDVNGNNRYLFEECTYTGVDLAEGWNVDIVSKGHEFNPGKQYDVVISTECFEHDPYWNKTIENCINLTKSGGLFLFTCGSEGRPEHGTTRSRSPWASPFSHVLFNEYYRNLSPEDVLPILQDKFNPMELEDNRVEFDLYFYGIRK